jgi:hypothetical protein
VDLCALYGYYEEHVVQTSDGYLLGLHRLGWRKGEEDIRVNSGKQGLRKRVVYLHHGLLMNSEVWVCLTDEERCLPFYLVEKGYDVWVSQSLPGILYDMLMHNSWGTIAGTNIPRSASTALLPHYPFGTSPWMSSHFTTFQTALIIS